MAPGVWVHLLGDVAVEVDGVPVTRFRSRRSAVLLALLLDTPGGLTRTRAAEVLWPDAAPGAGRAELSRLLHDLRRRLGPVVDASPRLLRLASGRVSSDVAVLAAAVGSADPELWQHAVDLTRGPFMADLDLDADRGLDDPLVEWLGFQRSQHAARVADLHGRLTSEAAGRGDDRQALARARRWAAAAPLDEAAHRAVMRTFAALGQRSAALAHYEALRETLAGSLGVDPDVRTARLAQQIDGGPAAPLASGRSSSPQAPRPSTPDPAPRAVPTVLPRRVGRLVGREAVLAAAERALAEPGVQLVTLSGAGGVGKTRLATELAHRAARTLSSGALGTVGAARPHRVVWADLAPVRVVDDVLPTLAELLRVPGGADTGADPGASVVRLLAGEDVLLVLDNLEQLPGAGAVVDRLLDALPRLRVLATTRGAVDVRGERLLQVTSLRQADAEAFLVDRLGETGTELPDDGADPEGAAAARAAVADICRSLEGLPLALELAASQARTLGVHGLRDRLRGSLAELEHEGFEDDDAEPAPVRPSRHRTLRETVGWSADLLGPSSRSLYADLGVFAGPFLAESAAAVASVPAAHVHEHLSDLAEVGLLTPLPMTVLDHGSPGGQRYRMLPTVAAVAIDELSATGREAAAREAHRHHLDRRARAANTWGVDARGRDQCDRLAELNADMADVRLALSHAATVSAQLLAEQVLGLRELWWGRRHGLEACQWIVRALTSPLGEIDPVTRVELLVMESHHRSILADLDLTLRVVEQGRAALEGVRGEGTAGVLRARLDTAEAVVQLYRDDLDGAAVIAARAFAGVERWQEQAALEGFVDTEAWLAAAYYCGAVTYHQGDVEATGRWADLGLRAALRSPTWAPACVVGVGDVARQRGDARTALGYYGVALGVARRTGEVSTPRVARMLAGVAALVLGEAVSSARLLGATDAAVELAPELWMPESAAARDDLAVQLEQVLGSDALAAETAVGRALRPTEVEALIRALAGDAVPDLDGLSGQA